MTTHSKPISKSHERHSNQNLRIRLLLPPALAFYFIFLFFFSFSQNTQIDSLLSLLKTDKEDTSKVNHLNDLAWELKYINRDTAIILATQALSLSEKIKWQFGIGKSHHELGAFSYLNGNYQLSLSHYFSALAICDTMEIDNKLQKAITLRHIGNVYKNQANFPQALDYFLKAIKIYEDFKDKNGITSCLSNIGIIFDEQGDYPQALGYYFKALKMSEELENKDGIAIQLGNIGINYYYQANKSKIHTVERDSLLSKALYYNFKSLKLAEELENKNHIAANLDIIGSVFKEQGDYKKSLDYYFKALKINEELRSNISIAVNLGNIGNIYTSTKKYAEAEKYLLDALRIDKEIGSLNGEKQDEEYLTELYTKTNRYQLALEHYKKAMALKDTIFNQEKEKEITRKEMNYEFEKKEAAAKTEQYKKDIITSEQKRKQQIIIYSVSGVLLLMFLLAGVIFKSLQTNKQKNKIITHQKLLVEEKQKEITDSITYALRIQKAILPHRSEIWKSLPQSFVLYKPKDIVAGDFYWFHKNNEAVLIAAADCTGHGVPGAFTSMICSEKLNEAVKHSTDPGEILSLVNKGIKLSFKHTKETSSIITQVKDGMDIALCSIDLKNGIVKYAGAYRPLWIIRKNSKEIEEIKATKTAIGGDSPNDQMYETHIIHLQQGDTIYLSSDGYADQDGGDKGKKLMTKTFKQMLIDIQDKPMKEQKEYLENFIEKWQADRHQLDDILVIGIRI